jgi:light-regulated signal transduction histidine kinase (bacteriophytochrome)
VNELIDPRASKDLYRGLHFPASDIPKQARELYMINTIRILYDRDQESARLVCRTFDDVKIPLNLKHSYLRSMSPIYIKYLANMGVRASMSISLIVDKKLWGLISCHNYGSGSGIHISLPVREICRELGNITSNNIQKLQYSSRINARRSLANAPPTASPFTYIASSTSELLNMFGADFGFLVIRGEARMIGKLFAYKEVIVLLQYIRQRASATIWHSHAVAKDFTELNSGSTFSVISGLLVVPLSLSGTDFLVFFRKGKLKEIKWAGNPYEKKAAAGTQYLEPRSSFKRWSENVIGTSREWTEDEGWFNRRTSSFLCLPNLVESAAVLSTLYGRFIEV